MGLRSYVVSGIEFVSNLGLCGYSDREKEHAGSTHKFGDTSEMSSKAR